VLAPGKKALKSFLPVLITAFILSGIPLETAHAGIFSSNVKNGIKAYEAKQYEDAKKQFVDAQLENPDDKRLYYNIGTAAYMNKDYEEALGHFSKALDARDAGLRHNARFNLANTHFRMGNMDEAIKEYEEVLKEFPDDREAKENLEFVKQKKEEKKSEPEQNKDGEKKDQEKDNKTDQDNKDGQEQKGGDQEQKNDSPADPGTPPDKNPDKPGAPPPEPGKENPGQDRQNASGASDAQGRQAGENLETMLNRLEDKPGSAMIPLSEGNHIEKDW